MTGIYVVICFGIVASVLLFWLWLAYTREPKQHVELVSEVIAKDIEDAVAIAVPKAFDKHFTEKGEGIYR